MRMMSVALFTGLTFVATAAGAADAKKRTEELVAAFKAVKSNDDGNLSAADKKANQAAFAKLDSFFDFDTMTTTPIKKHKSKFNAEQLAEFSKMFRELIRMVSYPSAGSFLNEAKSDIGAAKVKGSSAKVTMHVELEEEDLEMDVTFVWANKGGTWRLVDTAFDGASLTKDYENQFGRIIGKDGADGLLEKLRKRYEKEKEEGVL